MRAAVIPTTGRVDLEDCIRAIGPQVNHIILISHNAGVTGNDRNLHVIDYKEQVPNISVMWNLGLRAAYAMGATHVAVLNDDAIVYPHWVRRIVLAMNKTGAVAGWSAGEHMGHLLYQRAEPTMRRMTGYAFLLDSQATLLADEQFQWWYGDNDLEWRAREAGGVVQVGGSIEHRHPNGTTVGILARIAEQDKIRFKKKWGVLP